MKTICQICHKEFNVQPYLLKRGKGKFCSRKCCNIFQFNKKENHPAWKGGQVQRICKKCGKIFMVNPVIVKRGGGQYCSNKCKIIYLTKGKSPFWKSVRRTCKVCGKEFDIPPSKIKKGFGLFCSHKCRRIVQTGKNHVRWKGGITPITEKIRHSDKYNQWRQKIFIRDKFTCQKCNAVGGILHAHHKKPFHKLIEEIKLNLPLLNLYEAAMIYTPLWDVNNGITYCKKCHWKN